MSETYDEDVEAMHQLQAQLKQAEAAGDKAEVGRLQLLITQFDSAIFGD